MNLQKYTKKRIDEFCGIEKLLKGLERLVEMSEGRERHHYEIMIQWFGSLYLSDMDVEKESVDNEYDAREAVEYLEKNAKRYNCRISKFLIEIIHHNLDHVQGVRNIKKIG